MVDASTPADWVRVGRPTTVRVTVRNPGGQRSLAVDVTHDGAPVSTRNVTIGADETAVFELQVVFGEPRTGTVAVAGVAAGELTVAAEDEPSPSGRVPTGADGGVGPAPLLLVVALAGLWRRYAGSGEEG